MLSVFDNTSCCVPFPTLAVPWFCCSQGKGNMLEWRDAHRGWQDKLGPSSAKQWKCEKIWEQFQISTEIEMVLIWWQIVCSRGRSRAERSKRKKVPTMGWCICSNYKIMAWKSKGFFFSLAGQNLSTSSHSCVLKGSNSTVLPYLKLENF